MFALQHTVENRNTLTIVNIGLVDDDKNTEVVFQAGVKHCMTMNCFDLQLKSISKDWLKIKSAEHEEMTELLTLSGEAELATLDLIRPLCSMFSYLILWHEIRPAED